MDKAEQIAEEHWEYLKGVLENAGLLDYRIEEIGYHYKTAFIHGWKHALEEYKQKNPRRKNKCKIDLK